MAISKRSGNSLVCRISFLPFPSSILVSRGLDDTLLENCLGPVTGSYENVVRMLRCRRLKRRADPTV
ncbi:hypothetical protein Pyn_15664 [Prunus yedoensis var. nudiflora]|uniref:Uncharacterized protein n=1 Tax=Prunus yedoensis var. nudiflora TaxID=2094558 RepID=A0A314YYP0_PRUYE|nr:hypothetical protein Pyn_15664 [Prunus yedoensis var. nudiflora]